MKHLLDIPDLPEAAFRPVGRSMRLYGKSDAPPPPDYRGAAEEQSAASKEIATQQTWANRPTVNTPWGQQTWSTNSQIDPSTGQQVTGWTSNISLTPAQQAALNSQQAIQQGRSNAAQDLLGQATGQFGQEIDYSTMPDRGGSVDPFSFSNRIQTSVNSDPSAVRQQATDAVWSFQKPALDDARSDTENQLSNMGLSRGSEAWNREMRRLDDSEARARLQAVDAGRAEAAQMFGQDLQSMQAGNNAVGQQAGLQTTLGNYQNLQRQQAIAEEMQRRGYSLNELNALLTGQQVNMPQMPGFNQASAGQAANYTGAAQAGYGSALDATNVANANQASQNSGLASAAMAALYAFSDIRLKDDIETVGILTNGVRVVRYRYRGLPGRHVGVIAQELAVVNPGAVSRDPSGYLKVDYSKV